MHVSRVDGGAFCGEVAEGVVEVRCRVSEGVDFELLYRVRGEIDVELVEDLRGHDTALAVRNHDNFLDLRVGAIRFHVLVAHARLLREEVERSLHDAFEEVAKNAVCAIVDAKDRSAEGLRQDIHVHLQVVSGDTAAVQEEPSFVRELLVHGDVIRVRRRPRIHPRWPLHWPANSVDTRLTSNEEADRDGPRKD